MVESLGTDCICLLKCPQGLPKPIRRRPGRWRLFDAYGIKALVISLGEGGSVSSLSVVSRGGTTRPVQR